MKAVSNWAYISPPKAEVYSKWVVARSDFLRLLRATDEPRWTSGPDVWELTISETPSVTVVGGRGAKRENVRIIRVADSLLEVDEDLLDSLGPLARAFRRSVLDPGGDPIPGRPPPQSTHLYSGDPNALWCQAMGPCGSRRRRGRPQGLKRSR